MEVDVFIQTENGIARIERVRVEGQMSIGRHAQSTLCLDGDLVSRTHVTLDLGTHGLRIEDKSSNGTLAGEVLDWEPTIQLDEGLKQTIDYFRTTLD